MKKIIITISLFVSIAFSNSIGENLFQDKCAGCHGIQANKKAFGKSKQIKGWNKIELENVLKGYEEDTFKDHLKNVMKKQLQTLKKYDKDLIIEYIEKLR